MPPLETPTAADADPQAERSARKRMLLIVNPHASTVTERLQHLVQYALAGAYELESIHTDHQGHATELARQAAAEKLDAVVVFSGDGTINEAAIGLHGSKTALTCLPGGSGNVYNRILGLPTDLIDATEQLLRRADDWRTRQVLTGIVNDRRFLFSAGFGLDAAVAGYVDSHPRWKHRFNEKYFAYSAFKVYLTRYLADPPALQTSWPGCAEPLHGVTTLVQKGDPYTYFGDVPLRAADGVALDEPVFSGMSLRTVRPTVVPGVAWRLFSKSHALTDHRQIDGFSGQSEIVVRSTAERPVHLMVDGDQIGQFTEARFTVDVETPLLVLA